MWSLAEQAYLSSKEASDRLMTDKNSLFGRKDLGYLQLHQRDGLWESSQKHAQHLRDHASRLIVVGMGGSSLGAKAFLQATSGADRSSPEVLFCDNVDPVAFARNLGRFKDSADTHWVLVSKSGTTIETLSTASLLLDSVTEPSKKFTVVTEPRESSLRKWAADNGVPCLEIPLDVGGRFSVFSPAGLFPIAFASRSLDEIRAGMEEAIKSFDQLALPLAEQFLKSFSDHKWIHALWSYVDDLMDFGLWFQQLWAESLAKSDSRDGDAAPRVSTPMALRGASDQHSVLQQIMQGERDKLITFVRVKSVEDFGPVLQGTHFEGHDAMVGKGLGSLLRAEAQATETALRQVGVPCLRLEGADLSDSSVAALMHTFMLVIGVMGESLNINAFDQPGVEAGKIITKSLLSER